MFCDRQKMKIKNCKALTGFTSFSNNEVTAPHTVFPHSIPSIRSGTDARARGGKRGKIRMVGRIWFNSRAADEWSELGSHVVKDNTIITQKKE